MSRRFTYFLLLAGLATALACSGAQPKDEGQPVANLGGASGGDGGVQYQAPAGWIEEAPSSAMRKGQYRLPRAEGDPEDAELAVFFFPGQGGSVQANIDRWIGQFAKPDGSPAADTAQVNEKVVAGKKVTILDVSGTYISAMGPMMASGPPKPNYRLLGAIIDTPNGPWFFKLTGPVKTIEKWEQSFNQFTESLRVG